MSDASRNRARRIRWGSALLLTCAWAGDAHGAQIAPTLEVTLDNGAVVTLPVAQDRGYGAVPSDALTPLGWSAGEASAGETLFVHSGGTTLRLWTGSPMLALDDQFLQMADPTYAGDGGLFVPVQLIVDLIPIFGPAGYMTERDQFAATTPATDPALDVPSDPGVAAVADAPATDTALPSDADTPLAPAADTTSVAGRDVDAAPDSAPPVMAVARSTPPPPSAYDLVRGGSRLVVIDAGHGGADVGTIGPGGVTEKSVALSVALALARELGRRSDLDVRVTRDRDIEVAPEYRGDWADQWREDRPAVFISIHANALAERSGVRGFETYFLGDPQTDQERRVAAVENGASVPGNPLDNPGLQALSADLAVRVQEELGSFHPGPDRGVRQAPFTVLGGTQMPSVLIEIGFITNPEEERALSRPEFHRQAAAAIASAIDGYFESGSTRGLP